MRRLTILCVTLLIASLAQAADFTPGAILVWMDDPGVLELSAGQAPAARDAALAPVLARHDLDRWSWIVPRTGARTGRAARLVRLAGDADRLDVRSACADLAATGLFRAVSPDWHFHLFITPNDPMLSNQWFITSASAGIGLPQAWDVTQGAADVVVAILDTGVDWSHPDLSASMWTNPGEVAGNGVDDDANGYVDDIHGWDCGLGDGDPRPEPYHEGGIDVGFHGTHCAGIASATTNNGVGVAGAGWNCRIMGLKITAGDLFSLSAITVGYDYAMIAGADVISMSFGGPISELEFMQALVNDATAAGIVCVAAAGNNNDSTPQYPAALDNVISVGATNSANQRASFSTYGTWVDLAAPGEHIWSCVQSNYEWDFLTALLFFLSYGWDWTNPYMYADGTSMACPLVAGVCGLVRSAAPWMDAVHIAQHLIETGDDVAYDQPLGRKVNAYRAVTQGTTAVPGAAPASPRIAGIWPNPFNPKVTIRFDLAAPSPARLDVYDIRGRRVRILAAGELAAGPHELIWDGCDDAGRAQPGGVYFARLEAGGARDACKLVLLK
ncbi:MAG: S8 family serine peptidase [Candidatus Krumholzibacteriota bacterium]|nr:S8 family serine peptidase [Candidatus Krumholzibacteriota bacterium]